MREEEKDLEILQTSEVSEALVTAVMVEFGLPWQHWTELCFC
jgi:hypothetical protein